jgi:hypothetical protein
MSIGTWGALVLLAQVSSGSPPECGERFDLLPRAGPLSWIGDGPYGDAVQDDLLCPGEDSPLLMVMNSSIKGMPEFALFMKRPAGSATANITVRRYRDNVWFAMQDWLYGYPKKKLVGSRKELERAALAAVSRKLDTFQADIDADTFEVIARVWSQTIDRARPDPRRPKFIVHTHVGYGFRSGDRGAYGGGRAPGGAAEQLIGLGNDLVAYATAAPTTRPPLRDQLAAAAAALEARLKTLKPCPPEE